MGRREFDVSRAEIGARVGVAGVAASGERGDKRRVQALVIRAVGGENQIEGLLSAEERVGVGVARPVERRGARGGPQRVMRNVRFHQRHVIGQVLRTSRLVRV